MAFQSQIQSRSGARSIGPVSTARWVREWFDVNPGPLEGSRILPVIGSVGDFTRKNIPFISGCPPKNGGILPPKMDGENNGKPYKWMMWGYPYFWKHPSKVGEITH